MIPIALGRGHTFLTKQPEDGEVKVGSKHWEDLVQGCLGNQSSFSDWQLVEISKLIIVAQEHPS